METDSFRGTKVTLALPAELGPGNSVEIVL